jgi:hypothetical protein
MNAICQQITVMLNFTGQNQQIDECASQGNQIHITDGPDPSNITCSGLFPSDQVTWQLFNILENIGFQSVASCPSDTAGCTPANSSFVAYRDETTSTLQIVSQHQLLARDGNQVRCSIARGQETKVADCYLKLVRK